MSTRKSRRTPRYTPTNLQMQLNELERKHGIMNQNKILNKEREKRLIALLTKNPLDPEYGNIKKWYKNRVNSKMRELSTLLVAAPFPVNSIDPRYDLFTQMYISYPALQKLINNGKTGRVPITNKNQQEINKLVRNMNTLIEPFLSSRNKLMAIMAAAPPRG
jgi:hypothetical protein